MPQKQYRTDFPVQPDAKVICWYGEKEGHMKKAIQRLRTAGQRKMRCRIRKVEYNESYNIRREIHP